MTALTIDPARSRVRIRTFAEGLFARLAHDLELVCRDVSGRGERTGKDTGTGTLVVPIAKIEVAGVLKDGTLDPHGLSASERSEALAKMQRDVFHGGGASASVAVDGTLEGRNARVRITAPSGRSMTTSVDVRVVDEGESTTRVSGRLELSLDSIGSDPVKGPMNAFRVKDKVEVLFDLAFVRA